MKYKLKKYTQKHLRPILIFLIIFSLSTALLALYVILLNRNSKQDNKPVEHNTNTTDTQAIPDSQTPTDDSNPIVDNNTDNSQAEEIAEEQPANTPSTTPSVPKTNTKPKTTTPAPTPTPEPEPDPEPPAPPPPESPSAVVAFYADNQSDTDAEDATHQRTVNNILNSGANPVFHAGDLMEDGTQASLDRFNSVTATLRSSRAFYAALGNNDRAVGDSSTPSSLFLNNFAFPNNERWYSVNYGNLHLVVLDSAFASGNSAQLNWLASDLQSSASQNRITGVMFHHPTFSSTISSYLVNYGVDFVIMGHNHAYQHTTSNGIHYFVLSGQPSLGHIIAKIYSGKVTISTYNNYNGVIESTSFNKR